MKFSAILIASLSASTSAFAPPSRTNINVAILSAATLEAPEETSTPPSPPKVEAAVEAVSTDMAVEKDWPVDIVKDSDRIMP